MPGVEACGPCGDLSEFRGARPARRSFRQAFRLLAESFECPHIHPADLIVDRYPAVREQDGPVIPEHLAQPEKGGGKHIVARIAFGLGPEGIGKIFFPDVSPPERNERLEQEQRLLLLFP